jgi:Leucine-rich repeat (LRR) protein
LDFSSVNADGGVPGQQSLSGTLPASLCELERLESLQFQFTQGLKGTLPDCLGAKQPKMQTFTLEGNQFNGSLPSGLCHASELVFLVLYQNDMMGTLPSCLGNLSNLESLDLNTNHFHGTLPGECCHVSELVYLVLYQNDLTGTLPSCLGSFSNLEYLDLNTNHFHGTLPE